MSNVSSQKTEAGILGDVSRNLGAFFRHLLPGVFIIGAAYVGHPAWFNGIDTKSWQHIALGATIALASGNIWFALNRYGIHQVIDYLVYLSRSQGPARESNSRYVDDLGLYVSRSLYAANVPESARQHIAFRASSVLLIYTIAEVGFLFAIWHENGTFFQQYSDAVIVCSVAIFLVGVWQNIITRRIDYYVILENGKSNK